ncbi:zinc finger and BTB domain-containing protein 24-like isoform X7 [Cloeon dipterum]|uniref:zinc finger and BTB domain-containing protein 24-like isoform X7 n=1 Tax=Cloeon dipterum TaxID=197152 RepID=UPI00321F85A3
MASRQYSLRWNNYAKHLSTAFDSLRSERDLTDVTLSCEGKRVPAHKMLLSACSSYFKSLFKENPCQHPVIIFRNVAFDDLMALVEFMYKGEVNVEEERLSSFLTTAELLEVQGLTNSGKDVDKSKKTDDLEKETDIMEQQPEADSSPFAPFVDTAKSSPPTPSASRKRRRVSPPETEEESLPKVAALEEDPVIESDDHDVHLKTEAPDFEHIELNPEDSVDADDMAAAGQDLESEVDNFAMAGPSNDSLVEDKDRPVVMLRNGRFQCGVCRKSYSSRAGFLAHYDLHLGKTKCDMCHKVLSNRSALYKHREEHLGLVSCGHCDRTFPSKYQLRRHAKRSETCAKHYARPTQPSPFGNTAVSNLSTSVGILSNEENK